MPAVKLGTLLLISAFKLTSLSVKVLTPCFFKTGSKLEWISNTFKVVFLISGAGGFSRKCMCLQDRCFVQAISPQCASDENYSELE